MLGKTLCGTLATTAIASMAAVFASTATAQEASESPYLHPEDSWISLSGEVVSVTGDSFQFDYGQGLITVEMYDWDWYNEAQQLRPGEEVTVYGKIDHNLYDERTIEAMSVYAKERNTYFYANPTDEEIRDGRPLYFPNYASYPRAAPEGALVTVSGTVESVYGREILVDTGTSQITVDTWSMDYNPVDEVGYQQVTEGDVIQVTGEIDNEFFDEKELVADTITTIEKDEKSTS